MMVTGKTESGFEYSYDKRILSDWRFTKAIAKSKSKDKLERLASVTEIADLMLGQDGMDRLIRHVQSQNDGFAPADIVEKMLIEIMKGKSEEEVKN